MSDIFYSQVNRKLANELELRGQAGKTGRSTKQLNYMLGKIANVELTAYEGKFDPSIDENETLYTLGGQVTKSKSFLPSGKSGYLNRSSKRPEPVITGVTVNIADNAQFQINTSTVTILIQDPIDLDIIERIFFKPGRIVKLTVQHPESAILSEDDPETGLAGNALSKSELVTSTRILQNEFPPEIVDEFLKMDRLLFTGLVSSFNIKYNEDVSITATLNLRATAGTYPDAEFFITNPDIELLTRDETVDKEIGSSEPSSNFHEFIQQKVNTELKDSNDGSTNPIEIPIPKTITINEEDIPLNDRSILYGSLKPKKKDNTNAVKSKKPEDTFITLGLLIDYLDDYIGTTIKNNSTTIGNQDLLFCNDQLCFSNYYEHLVSADPTRVLLWPGTNNFNTNVYKQFPESRSGITAYNQISPKTPGFFENREFQKFDTAGEEIGMTEPKTYGHPSRIYINLKVIKEIVETLTTESTAEKPTTIKQFLNKIKEEIGQQTSYAIRMALIQHPDIPDALLYYDTNYLGKNKQAIPEFTIPVFSGKGSGTVVREFKLGFDLPDAYKTTLIGFAGTQPSATALTAFNPYIFSDSEEAKIIRKDEFEKNYVDSLKAIKNAREAYGNDQSESNITSLQKAISGHIAYPDVSIESACNINAPIWPMNLEFTIDGINGFIYGDVLFFRGLPSRYNQQFVFCISKIKHTISDSGEWTTSITCFARSRILEVT